MIKFEDIAKANESIRTTDIKGKDYAEVNQRIKAYRMCYPNGCITTEIISIENGVVLMKTTVTNEEGAVIGTGYAYEKENSTFINKTSYIENCETSAVGRALGMCGFGIDTSVASYEEVANAIENQKEESTTKKAPKTPNKAQNNGYNQFSKGNATINQEEQKIQNSTKMSAEQLSFVNSMEDKLKAFACKKFNIATIEDLTSEQAQYIIDSLKAKENK